MERNYLIEYLCSSHDDQTLGGESIQDFLKKEGLKFEDLFKKPAEQTEEWQEGDFD